MYYSFVNHKNQIFYITLKHYICIYLCTPLDYSSSLRLCFFVFSTSFILILRWKQVMLYFATQYYEAGCAVCGQQTTNLCKQTFDRRSKISAYIGRITVKYNPFFKGKPLLFPLLWKFSSFPQPARFFCCLWRCFGRVFVLSNIVYIAFLVRRHIEY